MTQVDNLRKDTAKGEKPDTRVHYGAAPSLGDTQRGSVHGQEVNCWLPEAGGRGHWEQLLNGWEAFFWGNKTVWKTKLLVIQHLNVLNALSCSL